MALLNVAGDYGEALRVTDSIGGCISFAQTPDAAGLDTELTGTEFSMGFAFRSITGAGGGSIFTCQIGIGHFDGLGPYALRIRVEKNDPDILVHFTINTTSCGEQTLHTETLSLTTDWHTAAITYKSDGNWIAYVDGVEVASDVAPCPDLTEDFSSSTNFQIWGSTVPGAEIFYVDEAWCGPGTATAAEVLDINDNGLTP